MKTKRVYILIILSLFLCLIKAELSPEDNIKKNKLNACVNLSKARIIKDDLFVDEMVDLMISRTGGDKKDKTDKLISMMLLTCYKKISVQEAEAISQTTEIDPMTNLHKTLLELESWKELYEKNDGEQIGRELDSISETMNEIREDHLTGDSTQEDKLGEEETKNNPKSIGVLGIDLSTMDPNVKNIIGFSFLGIIALLAVYGLFSLKKEDKKDKKKKEKRIN